MTLKWVQLYVVGGFIVLQAMAQTPTPSTTPKPPADVYCYVCESSVVGNVCNDPYSKKHLTPIKCESRTCFKKQNNAEGWIDRKRDKSGMQQYAL